jgi:hypothetical protein
MPKSVTLYANCAQCFNAVKLEFDGWAQDGPATEAAWLCPHCEGENRIGAIGRVRKVAKARPSDRS